MARAPVDGGGPSYDRGRTPVGDLPASVALVSSPNTFTAVPQQLSQPSGGGTVQKINMHASRSGQATDRAWEVNVSGGAFGTLPIYLQNDGGFYSPGYIVVTGAGQPGAGLPGVIGGGASCMIGALSDLSNGQPSYLSQINGYGQYHFLCQDTGGQKGFLISGGLDNPGSGGSSPVLWWGPGSTAGAFDTKLYRSLAGVLETVGSFSISNARGSNSALNFTNSTDGQMFRIFYDGGQFGNLYIIDNKNSVTAVTFTLGGYTQFANTRIGFFGATPIVKPAVTGSRGANAALTSLMTTLANLGLVTDSTT